MKQVLSLQNRGLVASVFMGLLLVSSSFTFGPVEEIPLADNPPQKKVQRVKITVQEDGKETKIDTTFNLPDEKAINFKVDSILKKIDTEGAGPDNLNFIVHRGEMRMKCHDGTNSPGDEQFDILIQRGDSGIAKFRKRMIQFGTDGSFRSLKDSDSNQLLPPPPPMPPHFPMEIRKRIGGDPFAFDTKDESVISYEKKDIGKGLEKITIIRKKQIGHQQNKKVQVKVETIDDSKK